MASSRRNLGNTLAGRAIAIALLLLAAPTGCGNDTQTPPSSTSTPLATTTIAFTNDARDSVELLVEVADTSEERARGLMFRHSLPEDQGMLFKFEAETSIGFWMKDTTIPLSIAFIGGDGVIIDIQDMEPLSLELHSPGRLYQFAVEMNQGWFDRNDVGVGSEIHLPPTTQTPE